MFEHQMSFHKICTARVLHLSVFQALETVLCGDSTRFFKCILNDSIFLELLYHDEGVELNNYFAALLYFFTM